jgi:hypothetical protein
MQIRTNVLIDDLIQVTENATASVKILKELSYETLNYKADPNTWSALECIEHLNLYGDFYLPEIEKQILSAKARKPVAIFKAGIIGNYFANLMQVNNGRIKKMKTPKDKNPANSALTTTTIDRFLKQQELLKSLLNQAKKVDLNKAKTAISLTKMIKLKLGDTFRFVIYHIDRHVQQAERATKN